jgi:hypothetical protein
VGNQTMRRAQRTSTKSDKFDADFYAGRNDRWLTPLDIVRALGTFDLDPCAAPGHPTALETWTPEDVGDGLSMPWHGRVWLNPPYGRTQRQWVERLVEHGSGVALLPIGTGTKLWQDVIFPNVTAIHFWRHRISFLREDADEAMTSPTESAILAFSEADADALEQSNLPGHLIRFEQARPNADKEN